MEELYEYVRKSMPLRARMLGREGLEEIVRAVVAEWPVPEGESITERQLAVTAAAAERRLDRREKRYGFIWTLLLSAVLSAVAAKVLEWWLERRKNQTSLARWSKIVRDMP